MSSSLKSGALAGHHMRRDKDAREPPPYPAFRWVLRLFPLPFILIGLVTLFLAVRIGLRAAQSRHWPSVEGVIRSSKSVSEIQSPDRSRGDGPTRSPRTVNRAAVVYDYRVGGRAYSGSTVSFGDFASSNAAHAAAS